jgi:hypothetical protein
MTVLNFLLTDEAVYLLADTILADADDLSPVAFATKIYAVPHIGAAICGTGHARAIAEWFVEVNLSLPARDVVHLDRWAPVGLRELFAGHESEDAAGRVIATTLYHFGFDARTSRFVGFAYRSENDFRSESLPRGFGFKPAPGWDIDSGGITRLPEQFIAIAERQKAQDEAAEPANRVLVGGQLVFCAMQRVPDTGNGPTVQTSLAVCHSFPDFERMHAQATARLRAP